MIKLIVFDLRKTLAYRDIPEERSLTMQNALHLDIPHDEFVEFYECSLQTRKWESRLDAYTYFCKAL